MGHVGKLARINSNIFVQDSQKRPPDRGWIGERLRVILSEAKDLARWAPEILRWRSE